MHIFQGFLAAGALALLALAASASPSGSIQPVAHVDLHRYMGRWYVIAMIPTAPERGAHNAVETYQLDKDGDVCTWYRLRPGSFTAPVKLIHSTAAVVPGTGNAQWSVHLYWLFRVQYLVGWLKPDYSQVMVVRDKRDYLWYMARSARVAEADYRAMLARAQAMGYDTAKIVKVPQRWPEGGAGSNVFSSDCD